MNDTPSPEQLRVVLAAIRQYAEPGPQCLDDDTIAALAGGPLDAEARAAAVPHLASCAACQKAVASVARALSDPSVAREIKAVAEPRALFYRLALPLAAAAAVVLVLAWPHPEVDQALHRAPTITAGAAPAALAPVGRVAGARALRWAAVEGADRYRVTLFDADGRVLYETELAGTTASIPDSISLVSGHRYLWKVDARTGFDRWAASDLIEFSIASQDVRR